MRRHLAVAIACAALSSIVCAPACLVDGSPRLDVTRATASGAGGARSDSDAEARGNPGAGGGTLLAPPGAPSSEEQGETGGSAVGSGGGGAPGPGGPALSPPTGSDAGTGDSGLGSDSDAGAVGAGDAMVAAAGAGGIPGTAGSGDSEETTGGSKAGAGGAGGSSGGPIDADAGGTCGDGIVTGTEECDLGVKNERRAAFTLLHGGTQRPVRPLRTSTDAVRFYRYDDPVRWSGATGLEALDTAWLFLHQDAGTGQVSLVVEAGAATQLQARAQLAFEATGLPAACSVILSDDPGELVPGPLPGTFTARWTFQRHTDGGVIGRCGFGPGVNSNILIRISGLGSLSRFFWLDGSGHRIALDPSLPIGLVTAGSAAPCRADCTRPRCGDGVLDGGESCDDTADPPCPASCVWPRGGPLVLEQRGVTALRAHPRDRG